MTTCTSCAKTIEDRDYYSVYSLVRASKYTSSVIIICERCRRRHRILLDAQYTRLLRRQDE